MLLLFVIHVLLFTERGNPDVLMTDDMTDDNRIPRRVQSALPFYRPQVHTELCI